MNCPICDFEMEVQEVEVSSAHQSGGDIIDANFDDMYVCPVCENIEPIIDDTDDGEDE